MENQFVFRASQSSRDMAVISVIKFIVIVIVVTVVVKLVVLVELDIISTILLQLGFLKNLTSQKKTHRYFIFISIKDCQVVVEIFCPKIFYSYFNS